MTIDLAAIREGIADACRTVDPLNCYTSADSVELPALIVGRPELQRHMTFGPNGRSLVKVEAWVVSQANDAASANADLDRWTVEVVDAIEADRDLGGACESLRIPPDGVQPGQLVIGSAAHPAIQVRIEVWGAK